MSVVDVADQGQSIGNFLVGHCDICQLVPGEDQNLFLFILLPLGLLLAYS
jgi:hypothetical protein